LIPEQGVPANPVAWLVSAGRFKGIDRLRKNARADSRIRGARMRPDSDRESSSTSACTGSAMFMQG
jgi:RNA polymerase sigma-70 factor, ECF subfamily